MKIADYVLRGTRALQPAATTVSIGAEYYVTDEAVLERSNGTSWETYSNSSQLIKAPVDGDFSWVDQGTATVTANANGGIFMKILGATGTHYKLRVKAVPTAPYVVTAGFLWTGPVTDFHQFGLVLYNGAKFTTYFLACVASTATLPLFFSQDFTNTTTFASNNLVTAINKTVPSYPLWLRITDNNTNKIFSYSPDGVNFIDLFSEARTTFLTATHVGFGGETENTSSQDLGFTLISWKEA